MTAVLAGLAAAGASSSCTTVAVPRGQTVAALPRIAAELQSRRDELVTVTELLGERFRWAVAEQAAKATFAQ